MMHVEVSADTCPSSAADNYVKIPEGELNNVTRGRRGDCVKL